jgi:hypothetical protein
MAWGGTVPSASEELIEGVNKYLEVWFVNVWKKGSMVLAVDRVA